MFNFELTEYGLHVTSGAMTVFISNLKCRQLRDRIEEEQDTPDFLLKEVDITFDSITLNFSQSEYIRFRDLLDGAVNGYDENRHSYATNTPDW